MKMKKMKLINLAFLTVLFELASCQKVVHFDLNKGDPRIVIEGGITDQISSCSIKLTKTVNYDQSNVFPNVSGAIVTISDDFGNNATLLETVNGVYTAPSYVGLPGRVYTLSVLIDGKTFTAVSSMGSPVSIDTLIQVTGGDNEISVNAIYQDPAGIENYYRFVANVNGKILKSIIIQEDKLRDGLTVTEELADLEYINMGDTVVVYLESIDKSTFLYFNALKDLSDGSDNLFGNVTLANPVSNVTGGALGFFSAHAVRKKKIIIQ